MACYDKSGGNHCKKNNFWLGPWWLLFHRAYWFWSFFLGLFVRLLSYTYFKYIFYVLNHVLGSALSSWGRLYLHRQFNQRKVQASIDFTAHPVVYNAAARQVSQVSQVGTNLCKTLLVAINPVKTATLPEFRYRCIHDPLSNASCNVVSNRPRLYLAFIGMIHRTHSFGGDSHCIPSQLSPSGRQGIMIVVQLWPRSIHFEIAKTGPVT